MTPTLRLVVFDVAGTTLVDRDEVNRCLRDALAGAGVRVSHAAVNGVMGLAKPEAIGRLLAAHGADPATDRQVAAIHDDFVRRMLADYRTSHAVNEVPGTSDLFRDLKRAGIGVAVDTGFSRVILNVLIERLGWIREGLLDASIASDEVPRGRPHPDMIGALMARSKLADPSQVGKVGDAPADLLEGTAAGCSRVIGVGWGTHTLEELQPFPHTHLVGSHDELRAALGVNPCP